MGRIKKDQPFKLVSKLTAIRAFLKLSQEEMIKLIEPNLRDARSRRWAISDFESGRRVPSMIEMVFYAKAVRSLTVYKDFNVEDLVDDECDLPWVLGSDSKTA